MIAESDAIIWSRLLDADSPGIDEPTAAALLQLAFRNEDQDRMNHLADKARSGTLSDSERDEAESYNRVGHLVAMIQARARQVLERKRSA